MVVQGTEAKDTVILAPPLITVRLQLYAKRFISLISKAVSYTHTFNPSAVKSYLLWQDRCACWQSTAMECSSGTVQCCISWIPFVLFSQRKVY